MARERFYFYEPKGGQAPYRLDGIHVVKGEKKFDVQLRFVKEGGRRHQFQYFQVADTSELEALLNGLLAEETPSENDDLPF